MKKIVYVIFSLMVVAAAVADDRIIQFVLSSGQHISIRLSDIASIRYDYHDQDSIDQAYQDSLERDQFIRDSLAREQFLRDSLYADSLHKAELYQDSVAGTHTLNLMIDSTTRFTLFSEALHRTGLDDSLVNYRADSALLFKQLAREGYGSPLYPANGTGTTGTLFRRPGYTLFAESDSVLHANGINSIDDLIAYANNTYGQASQWYDHLSANGINVSTGDDYTNRYNALNMFVAYHILKLKAHVAQLVYEKSIDPYWNYAPDADPYNYYETMLPHTMLKVWEPAAEGRTLYLNRYRANNTLTDLAASQGSDAMHTVIRQGVKIARDKSVEASNGYIHEIDGVLVYDETVPHGVLNERMRFGVASLFPELITNGFASCYTGDGNISYMYDTSRLGIPNGYFSNMKLYNSDICIAYCLHGAWRCWQSSQIQAWGRTDFSVKLPPVPAGVYEVRITYARSSYNSHIEYSTGTNPNDTASFTLLREVDFSIHTGDPRIGLTDCTMEEDQGLASDKALRANGYMRAPYSYCGHGELGWSQTNNVRCEYGIGVMRIILGTITVGSDDVWLHIKSQYPIYTPLGIDYVELCPVNVADNDTYMEDWY